MRRVRRAWTDGRLDDLNARMERGFDRVDADIRDLRSEMNSRFEKVDARFEKVDARFDALHRTMVLGFASIVASVVASQLAAALTSHF
ncbi:MAG TPA: hypothetical protein VHI77_08735 [Solirubrobacterales bacterium]|jgi:hypothetical protein|nr:hypothetical protein [Solirubrobacterales bacterium]